jgi:hypothetical protein
MAIRDKGTMSEGPKKARAREIVMALWRTVQSVLGEDRAPNLLILGLSEIWIDCIVG